MKRLLAELDPEVHEGLEGLAAELRARRPGLWVGIATRSNDMFPLSATMSCISGDLEVDVEDVVFSLQFKGSPALIHFSADIATGTGEILLDGPTGDYDSRGGECGVSEWARERVDAALTFARANTEVLERALGEERVNDSLHD